MHENADDIPDTFGVLDAATGLPQSGGQPLVGSESFLRLQR